MKSKKKNDPNSLKILEDEQFEKDLEEQQKKKGTKLSKDEDLKLFLESAGKGSEQHNILSDDGFQLLDSVGKPIQG